MSTSNKLEDLAEPFVLNKLLDWEILKWDIEKWSDLLKNEELEFRMGKSKHTQEPQWENTCEKVTGTFKDFLEFAKDESNSKHWLYFDYKYLKTTFLENGELRNSIKWDKTLGLSGKTCDDSVIWIGNKGAHTPCHMDTYGCNFVAQIYGRKRWLLFPPNQNLRPTRVPYEESSVYSKFNFYSPKDIKEFKDITQCRTIILEPGQILFVPKGWWHYVENLDVAISINIWLPLPSDHEKRIEEAITLALISSLTSSMSDEEKRKIINSHDFNVSSVEESLNYINYFVEKYRKQEVEDSEMTTFNPLIKQEMVTLTALENSDFVDLIKKQTGRFVIAEEKDGDIEESNRHGNIISAFTDPDVVEMIKMKLLNK